MNTSEKLKKYKD